MNLLYNFLLLFFLLFLIPAESANPLAYSCGNNNGSTEISKNIENLLPILVSGTNQSGFITTSYGKNEAQIYGLGQCRGDVPNDVCSSCIHNATIVVRDSDHCPNQSDARIWYDHCFLRYNTNNNFFGDVDTSGSYYYNVEKVTRAKVFNEKLEALMANISAEAVKPVLKWLGKGNSTIFSPNVTIYALVQCTRDLSDLNCKQCLESAISNSLIYCHNRKGCRVLYSSCYVRYELYSFFYPV